MSELSKSRQQQWAAHIRACPKSGLTQKAYCQKHGLKQSQFWYWQGKLKRAVKHAAAVTAPPSKENLFIPVTIDQRTYPSGGLMLAFTCGIQLTGIMPGDLDMVWELVEVLK